MKTTAKIIAVFGFLAFCSVGLADELLVPAEYPTIQAAINAAVDGDVVIVADGTYTGDGNRDIDFLGKAITVRSESGPENCIIDCNGTETEPHRGFYFHRGEDATSIVAGFTITNGYATHGGGIYCENSSPMITNCTINGNSAEWAGGGIYSYGSPTITNCTITGNLAEWGGGVYCGGGWWADYDWQGSSPRITNCTINGNSAEWAGGGIYSYGSPTITNCTITGNLAEWGGGVYCGGGWWADYDWQGSSPTITNCILWDNTDSEIYGSPIVTYSDIKGGFPGEGNIDKDPCFALTTDYHLMPPSPCIDAGTNTPAGGLPAADKDGVPRPLDGDGDGNDVADMGAYEYSLHSPTIAVSSRSFYFVQDWPKPDPQTLQIRNCGGQPLQWEIVEDCSWLEVAPANGVSTDQINEVTITVDPNGLMPGFYSCTFNVQDQNASNSPVAICVTMPLGTVLRVPSPNYPTIQAAIDAADNYDVVLVADGVYTGEGNRDIDFLGKPITVRSESGPENCIIDCNGTEAEAHRGFVFYNGENANSILDGFTITNGYTRYDDGGGIYCEGYSSPIITNCTIKGNSSPTITNCTIKGNSSGIYCRDSNPTITNCTISENGIGYGPGGGIYCEASSPTITNCTISGNGPWRRPPIAGGGIYCDGREVGSSPTITNCTITGNQGGITCGHNSSPIIKNCTISVNRDEGIFCRDDSNPTITNCIITCNLAEYGRGDGIYCNAGSLLIITNCTIAKNQGRGVYCSGEGATITNCILWDNTDSEIYGSPIVTCSDIKGGFPGEGNIDKDPYFALTTDYHLMPGSPCIDAGTNDPCDGLPAADKNGVPRPLDGDGDSNAVADMGAYEYTPNSPSIAVSAVSFHFIQDWPKPDPQTLQIRNCGGQPLQWEIVEDCNWLGVAPADGVSTDQINEVTITVDPNGRAPGLYSCTFNVQDQNASNSPVAIQATMPLGTLLRVPSPNCPTIQAAIDAADNYDVVLVADGVYTGEGNRDIDFLGKRDTDFLGKAITVRSESGPENCIIDCKNTGRGFYFHSGETAYSVLDGFTITNGDEWRGGGIYCEGYSSPTITNCTIKGNSSGIYCRDSNPTITNCTISENGIGYGPGGGIFCEASSPTITNCTISGNGPWRRPPSAGGGIYCDGWGGTSSPTITNCTITGNWGGITCGHNSSPTIKNCTISGNRDEGIYCSRDSSLIINNSILWANTPFQIREDGASINVRYTDVQGGWEGESNMDEDPCFVEPGYLDDNGTPEDIWDDFWIDGDYYLLPDSFCIDAGDPNYIPEPNETDLDGNPRVIGDAIDMGAYETNYIQAAMKLTPQMLNCNSKGNFVKAHITLPEGFLPQDVDVNESAWAEPMGIESEYIKVLGSKDGPVRLEIAFDREAFCDSVTETGEVKITVIGSLTTSRYFYATDTIRIINNKLRNLAVFASHWLEEGCGKPDWCGGADVDRNSVVDFVDYVLFDGSLIKAIKK